MNDEALALLLLALASRIETLTKDLRDGVKSRDEWQSDFLRLLAQYLTLAMLRGTGQATLSPQQEMVVAQALSEQVRYLNGFANAIKETGWEDKYLQRAEMYVDSIQKVYWQGVADCMQIPTPADGSSECGIWCKCRLSIEWLNKANCDADVQWIVDPIAEHCNTCIVRGEAWRPLRVRGGNIQ